MGEPTAKPEFEQLGAAGEAMASPAPAAELQLDQSQVSEGQSAEAKSAEAKPIETKAVETKPPTSIGRCWLGAAIAAALGYGGYNLTFQIATQFASHPLVSDNYIAIRLSSMVRTLVVGLAAMATGILAFAALGLAILGLQIAFQKLRPNSSSL
jgi:hypothetical protein